MTVATCWAAAAFEITLKLLGASSQISLAIEQGDLSVIKEHV